MGNKIVSDKHDLGGSPDMLLSIIVKQFRRMLKSMSLKSLSIEELTALLLLTCGPYEGSTSDETNLELVELLLDNGADVEGKSNQLFLDYGITPLAMCAANNRVKSAEILIRNGAKVNVFFKTLSGTLESPLCFAAGRNYHEMVSLLLENGASLDLPFIWWPVNKLLSTGADLITMKMIFDSGIDPVDYRRGVMSLLDTCFSHAVQMEINDPYGRYNISMVLVRFFLQIGCPDIHKDQIRDAVRSNALNTLILTYMNCLALGRRIAWSHWRDDDMYSSKEKMRKDHAVILKSMIQRTRSHCGDGENVLKYLNELIGDKSRLVPRLVDISINAVRSALARSGRNVEDSVDELPMPVPMKKKLRLTDLQKQLEKSIV